jgi:hypothetical protein
MNGRQSAKRAERIGSLLYHIVSNSHAWLVEMVWTVCGHNSSTVTRGSAALMPPSCLAVCGLDHKLVQGPVVPRSRGRNNE